MPRAVERRAFTLVEMLVSLAVIVVALAVVVTAFTITTRTARQAAAFAELQGWVRQFTSQVREDLRACEPSRSVMVMVGRTQKAALTADDLAAQRRVQFLIGDRSAVPSTYDPAYAPGDNDEYSDPRADILMFFTHRPTVSAAPCLDPENASAIQQAVASGAKISPVQVVYGHAAVGRANRLSDGTFGWSNALTHIGDENAAGFSLLPAGSWHLARRVALPQIINRNQPNPPQFSAAEFQRLVRCSPEDVFAADVVDFDYDAYLAWLDETFASEIDYNGRILPSPYTDSPAAPGLYEANAIQNAIDGILYADKSKLHVATVLENPPVDLRRNLGVQLLPGCAWFQVEFLMPEDARNSLDYDPDPLGQNQNGSSQRGAPLRWVGVGPGETYVFLPDTPENRHKIAYFASSEVSGGLNVLFSRFTRINPDQDLASGALEDLRIRLWPYAIRLTIRAYDPRGRLNEPIYRTIMHCFQ